jgi:steroid delta-isomerase-like uncharacterized protein
MTLIAEPAIADPAAVEEIGRHWEKAWNNHDGSAVAALCAEGLVYDEPALGDTVYGREAICSFVNAMAAAYPDHTFALEGVYADVARRAVLVAWRFSGTHAKSGKRIEFHGDDLLDFDENGLISAYRCLYDNALVFRQLGKTPR